MCLPLGARREAHHSSDMSRSYPRSDAVESPRDCARERIAEIGEILAAGLIRLRARQSSQLSSGNGESSLASLASQSGHENRGCVESSS
jgi:hypothetical protein